MASIISGFEHDIFISYRQNDNRYDGWVTEFVANLNRELEATIKDHLSIYFDENPYDGLLETHHVDPSLAQKLKCLIFIPILSQTYCDDKSYAWNNEFMVFNKTSAEDIFGTSIRLPNGNVTGRILPVKIHELDRGDVATLEKKLGGDLRAIEFIYKSPGVNRPLRPRDDDIIRSEMQLLYRDQINKVANATKEIIEGLKSLDVNDEHVKEVLEKRSADKVKTSSQISFRVKILKQVDIFAKSSKSLLDEVAHTLKMATFGPGDIIINKGDRGSTMYIIVDGRVKVHDGQHVFSFLNGGDCFGEYSLIDEQVRSASVTVVEEATLFKLEKESFEDLTRNNPTFINEVLKVLVDRLRKLDAIQTKLSTSNIQISQQNKEIAEKNKELENLNLFKDRIIKIVAKDLRTQVADSLEIGEKLKKKISNNNPELKKYLKKLTLSLQKVNEIIAHVLKNGEEI